MELLFYILLCLLGAHAAKLSEGPESELTDKTAILAIQIVDPSEKADGKNLKRTIESSLGYGYQNSVHSPPKYQIYKYSQHDIPAYKGPLSHGSVKSSGISNYYQPGTTLFSTINQHGVVGDLSGKIPQPVNYHASASVPVIILRVLPAQLTSNHLYPSLPQSNDFAPVINSLDIKSLLTNYLSKVKSSPLYSDPKYQPEVGQPETYSQSQEQYYNQPTQTDEQNLDYDDQSSYNNYQGHNQQPESQIYQSQSYTPEVTKTSFDIVRSIEREPEIYTQQSQFHGQQYLPAKLNSPQQYHHPTQMSQSLLTHENYPSHAHTRVIFKTPEGHIRTSQQDAHSDYQDQEAPQQVQLPEPSQNLDYAQYGDQNVDYGDNTGDASYGSEQQQGDQQNHYSYIQPQYYSNQEYSQGASQKTVYIYPKSYENISMKPASKKRVAKSTEPPQYGTKLKKQKSS